MGALMPHEPHDTTAADAQRAEPRRNPWPHRPEPFDVEHVTMSGGLFGGLDVIRGEYIDRSKPRRGLVHRLFRRTDTPAAR
jgi:hypothetical protein